MALSSSVEVVVVPDDGVNVVVVVMVAEKEAPITIAMAELLTVVELEELEVLEVTLLVVSVLVKDDTLDIRLEVLVLMTVPDWDVDVVLDDVFIVVEVEEDVRTASRVVLD